jgi:hypothetical protein
MTIKRAYGHAEFTDLIDALQEFQRSCTCGDGQTNLPAINAIDVGTKYNEFFRSEAKPMHRSAYDDGRYPSLFSGLRILEGGKGLSTADLPVTWTPGEIAKLREADPLVAFLIAFIWKQGDFNKVNHVLEGIRAPAKSPTGESVVLRQFGRHLAQPLMHPIFDQHTNRARYLFDAVGRMSPKVPDALQFEKNCRGREYTVLFEKNAASNSTDLDEYTSWWTKRVEPRLPSPEAECTEAIQWVDRWLFSLGKEAKTVLGPDES